MGAVPHSRGPRTPDTRYPMKSNLLGNRKTRRRTHKSTAGASATQAETGSGTGIADGAPPEEERRVSTPAAATRPGDSEILPTRLIGLYRCLRSTEESGRVCDLHRATAEYCRQPTAIQARPAARPDQSGSTLPLVPVRHV